VNADARMNRLELVSAILLAIATVFTAWSAFQANKWGGVMSIRFAEANTARTESTQASTTAGQLATIDVTIFTEWAQAVASEQSVLEQFFQERFRDEFRPAFDAWIATDPLQNPDAPPTPFAMPEYQLADAQRSTDLAARADQRTEQARQANQRGDNYVLTTVLFAAVLFFAGVSTKFTRLRTKTFAVGFAVALLMAGIVVLATFPVEI
jgi:hypothetical protein